MEALNIWRTFKKTYFCLLGTRQSCQ